MLAGQCNQRLPCLRLNIGGIDNGNRPAASRLPGWLVAYPIEKLSVRSAWNWY